MLAVNHVYCQAPLAKAACAPNAVQVGLIVWVPVLVHRKVKIDDHRHLFNINTCTREAGRRQGEGVPSATHTQWHWRHGWDRSHVACGHWRAHTKGAVAEAKGHNSTSQGASGNLPTTARLLASLPPKGINQPLLGRNGPQPSHLQETMSTRTFLAHRPGPPSLVNGASLCSPRAHTLVVTRTFSLPSLKRSITAALCSTIISPLSRATWWPSLESSAASQLAVLRVWSEKNCF